MEEPVAEILAMQFLEQQQQQQQQQQQRRAADTRHGSPVQQTIAIARPVWVVYVWSSVCVLALFVVSVCLVVIPVWLYLDGAISRHMRDAWSISYRTVYLWPALICVTGTCGMVSVVLTSLAAGRGIVAVRVVSTIDSVV